MPSFGKQSKANLDQCHGLLKAVANRAIQTVDFSVIKGHRDEEEQNELFTLGLSKLEYPDSKHNKEISEALDLQPYPLTATHKDRIKQFYFIAGAMMMAAHELGVVLRWGGDWDMDGDLTDQLFNDLYHFELVLEERE